MSWMYVVALESGATGTHLGMSKGYGNTVEGDSKGRYGPKTNEGVHGQSSRETRRSERDRLSRKNIIKRNKGKWQGRWMKECWRRAAGAAVRWEQADQKTSRSGTERSRRRRQTKSFEFDLTAPFFWLGHTLLTAPASTVISTMSLHHRLF